MASPRVVERRPRGGNLAKEADELRRGHAEQGGDGRDASAGRLEPVERLGDERGVVVVVGGHGEPAAVRPAAPEGRGLRCGGRAVLERQPHTQPADRGRAILRLRAALGGLGHDAGRVMHEHDGRLDLVAMLPSRAAATGARLVAVAKQVVRGQGGRVHAGRDAQPSSHRAIEK